MSVERAFINDLDLSMDAAKQVLGLRPNPHADVGPPYLAHLLAREYVPLHYCSQMIFDAYFTFATIRDPWSRAVSLYRYLHYDEVETFEQFALVSLDKLHIDKTYFVRPQLDYVADTQGNILVDQIITLKELNDKWAGIAQRLNLSTTTLPMVNKSGTNISWKRSVYRSVLQRHPQIRPWRDHYTDKAQQKIEKLYAADIEAFDFKCPL